MQKIDIPTLLKEATTNDHYESEKLATIRDFWECTDTITPDYLNWLLEHQPTKKEVKKPEKKKFTFVVDMEIEAETEELAEDILNALKSGFWNECIKICEFDCVSGY